MRVECGVCWYMRWCVLQVGTSQTLEAQYKKIKVETTTSHVKQYGDLVSLLSLLV